MSRSFFSHVDWHLITPVIVLALMSLSTLFSINQSLFTMQLLFFIFSFLVYILFSHIHIEVIKLYALPIYIISVFALLLVFILGSESKGAVRWISFFGIHIQISEVLKPFLALAISSFLSTSKRTIKTFLLAGILVGFIAFLIQQQPDLGNALIYIVVSFLVMLYYGFSIVWFAIIGILLILMAPLIWYFLHDYQKKRVLTFLHPTSDPLGTSYNAIQSIIAVGSGMLFGKGLGEGTQSGLRFLPERHTDFIFATLSEEFGFLGGLVLFLCFMFLLYRIYKLLIAIDDRYLKLFCACTFFLFLVQLFFNIGMNIGVLPIVGITLPFVSYGGSSLLSNFIFLGLISSINKTTRDKEVLEIK